MLVVFFFTLDTLSIIFTKLFPRERGSQLGAKVWILGFGEVADSFERVMSATKLLLWRMYVLVTLKVKSEECVAPVKNSGL